MKKITILMFMGLLLPAVELWALSSSQALAERNAQVSDSFQVVGDVFGNNALGPAASFVVGGFFSSPVRAHSYKKWDAQLVLGAAAARVDKSSSKLTTVNPSVGSDIVDELPDYLPLPLIGVQFRFGLPDFWFFESNDLGLWLGGFGVSTDQLDLGLRRSALEFRGNVLEESMTMPMSLTLGLAIQRFSASLDFAYVGKLNETSQDSTFVNHTYVADLAYSMALDANVTAFQASIVASKKVSVITPYLGLAIQVASGTVDFKGSEKSDMKVDGNAAVANLAEGIASNAVPSFESRLVAGLELKAGFFRTSLSGEYGLISGGAGGHLQLGVSF